MSATKATRKWAKTATSVQLQEERDRLRVMRDTEKNGMIRSSFYQRIEIIDAEIKKRVGVTTIV